MWVLLKELLRESFPPNFDFLTLTIPDSSFDIPQNRLSYMRWLIDQLNKQPLCDLSYKDHKYDLVGWSNSFDELFYHIDSCTKFIKRTIDEPIEVMLDESSTKTLIEYFYNSKRGHDSLDKVLMQLNDKTLGLVDVIERYSKDDQRWIHKNYRWLTDELSMVYEILIERNVDIYFKTE